jgi:predicted SAM-dependent methyltransferase
MAGKDDLILEIGCGDEKEYADSIGLDIRRTDKVDVIADARKLPFIEGCFGLIYTSHTIEHFSHREIRTIITDWVRVLKTGGTLEIRCPDLRARALLFFIRPSWDDVKNKYRSQDYPENLHKSGYSYGILKKVLRQSGIDGIRRVIRGYRGVPFLPDSLHIIGTKHCAKNEPKKLGQEESRQ